MKTLRLILGSPLLAAATYAQTPSSSSATQLTALDDIISDPLATKMLTDQAYRKLIYRDQQGIGGSVIREGRVVGTTASVSDKGLTFNLGFPLIPVPRGMTVALQATGKAQSDEGFVNLFSKGAYSNTVSYGASALLFFKPPIADKYTGSARLLLHRQLRNERYTKEGQQFTSFSMIGRGTAVTWDNPGEMISQKDWEEGTEAKDGKPGKYGYKAKLLSFAEAWRNAYRTRIAYDNRRDQKNPSAPAEVIASAKEAYASAEADRQQKEEAALFALPDDWGQLNSKSQKLWLNTYLPTGATAVKVNWLSTSRESFNERARKKRVAYYDSLQLQAPWAHRVRWWLSLNLLGNVVKQPLFDLSQPGSGYKRDYKDNYFEGQLAANFLSVHSWGKHYFSAGLGLSNKLNFDKKTLITRQYTTTDPTTGVATVAQAQSYPVKPDRAGVGSVQAQYSLFFSKPNVGLDGTFRNEWGLSYPNRQLYTVGIFFLVKTGESTLLLMPQVRWATIDDPNEFTLGINLAASIPGFVTKKKF